MVVIGCWCCGCECVSECECCGDGCELDYVVYFLLSCLVIVFVCKCVGLGRFVFSKGCR